MVPRTSEVSQNGDPRTLKEDENQQCPMTSTAAKKIYSKQYSLNFNANPANPFSLQISSQPVTRGAGGRGEALGIRPHPAGCEGRANSTDAVPQVFKFLRLRGVRPLPPAPPIFTSKFDQKSNRKKSQNFDSKWPPTGTLKISKI